MILTSYNIYISIMRFKRTFGVIHICVVVEAFPDMWQWSKLIVSQKCHFRATSRVHVRICIALHLS